MNLHFGKIKLDLTQAIDREIYLSGFYEKDQLNYLNKICSKKKIDYFFDIGSNDVHKDITGQPRIGQ